MCDSTGKANFTTFRFARKDRDWQVEEAVKIVVYPRSKDKKYLGSAQIISKEPRYFMQNAVLTEKSVSDSEAQEDGFLNLADMILWMDKQHGKRIFHEPMNKLTLRWRRFLT